ncbi:MAG: cell division protein ZapE [Nevskiaceae bacterium]|nr:MAG: cell division protein ZapE [Nevskiaceae bacterium]TBR72976.1 MAG: cell division protein ZapE [Nevskiaceae bacterium]
MNAAADSFTPPDDLGPRAAYELKLASGEFVADPAQRQAVFALQAICDVLRTHPPKRRFGRHRHHWPGVGGLYLWGGVGRGKTWLMDTFFAGLPFPEKQRTHFHRFMLQVQELLDHYRDEEDPLLKVAREIATHTRVLCFDEFQVYNIADAMVLGRLFDGLFARGVTLVATSNVVPDDLYKDGLQRERFLPAIAAIKKYCTVLNVDSGVDYRLRALHAAPIYLCPDDAASDAQLARLFIAVAGRDVRENARLTLNGRRIPARRLAGDVAWFTFEALCEGPRGTADYVALAQGFHTVVLSHVPRFDAQHEAPAQRFINLVDEFYDQGVKLILSAAARPETLYAGKRLIFEFQRTCSRLIEMQSEEYLAAPHAALPAASGER